MEKIVTKFLCEKLLPCRKSCSTSFHLQEAEIKFHRKRAEILISEAWIFILQEFIYSICEIYKRFSN